MVAALAGVCVGLAWGPLGSAWGSHGSCMQAVHFACLLVCLLETSLTFGGLAPRGPQDARSVSNNANL